MQHNFEMAIAPLESQTLLTDWEITKAFYELASCVNNYEQLIKIALLPKITLQAKTNFLSIIKERLPTIIRDQSELIQVSAVYVTNNLVISILATGLTNIEDLIAANNKFDFIRHINNFSIPEFYTFRGILTHMLTDLDSILKIVNGFKEDEAALIFNFMGKDAFMKACKNTGSKRFAEAVEVELTDHAKSKFFNSYHSQHCQAPNRFWAFFASLSWGTSKATPAAPAKGYSSLNQ